MNIQLSPQEICNFFIQSSDIVYIHSAEGMITYTNENIENHIGYTSKEIIGKHFVDFLHPEDVPKAVDIHERASKNDPTPNFCLRIRHKDGRFLYFDFKSHAIFKDGVFRGGIGAGQDITSKKIREDALGKSESIYKVVVDNAQDVIYTVSPEGIVTSVNDFMKNVTGFSAEEVIGKQYLHFVHPDEVGYGIKMHEAIMRGEKLPVIEMRFLKKSGDYLNGEFSITPLFHEGKFLGTLGIGRDITEKKKNEENLKLALLKERQLNELKQHFISIVSHEFRTPLMIINGTAELLEREFKAHASDNTHKGFTKIKENVKRISGMLSDIMLLCDEKHNDLFNPEPVNIIDFCSDIIKDISQISQDQELIDFSHCEKISADSQFSIDREIMRHILINLLSNAVKYSTGKKEPVKFRIENEEKHLKFTISDKGIGIPEDYMKTIFQNFMRAGNVGKITGTGMGLAIVKKCVDIHKGEITIESVLDQGTCAAVKIPI